MIAEARPAPPATLEVDPDGIPHELKARNQWTVWRWQWDGTKWTKVPVDPKPGMNGRNASSTDPETWASFDVASACYQRNRSRIRGVMFVITEDDPYFGLDYDKAIDSSTGELAEGALALIDRFGTFAELSTTRSGVHAIGRGSKPGSRCKDGAIAGVELYDHSRAFVMTGHTLGYTEILDCQDALDELYAELFPESERPTVPLTDVPLTATEDELLERCMVSPRFRRLFDNDNADYANNASRGDLAFCNSLVRAGATPDQVDAIWRRSHRLRPKLDQQRGARLYGEMTIDKAFDGTVIPFEPRPRPNRQDAGWPDALQPTGTDGANERNPAPRLHVVNPVRRDGKMPVDNNSATFHNVREVPLLEGVPRPLFDQPANDHERWLL